LENTETEVRGDMLVIGSRRWGWFSWGFSERVEIYITVNEINDLSVGGSGKIIGENKFTSDNMDIDVSGSGRIEFNTDAKNMEISISGSGKIELKGTSKNNDLHISGSGKLLAEYMEAESYEVHISGSGSARVNVKTMIDARISGSGSVYYKGDPDKVRSDVSGSGRVRRM